MTVNSIELAELAAEDACPPCVKVEKSSPAHPKGLPGVPSSSAMDAVAARAKELLDRQDGAPNGFPERSLLSPSTQASQLDKCWVEFSTAACQRGSHANSQAYATATCKRSKECRLPSLK